MQQLTSDINNALYQLYCRITTGVPECVAKVADSVRQTEPESVRSKMSIQDLMSDPALMERVAEQILTKEELHQFLCTDDACYKYFLSEWIDMTRSQRRFGVNANQMDAFQREIIQGLIKSAIGSHKIGCLSYHDFLLKYLLEQEVLATYMLRALVHAQTVVPIKEPKPE